MSMIESKKKTLKRQRKLQESDEYREKKRHKKRLFKPKPESTEYKTNAFSHENQPTNANQ